jgi:hypothetical protein
MNAPISMLQVIQGGVAPVKRDMPGMSDDQLDNEYTAMRSLFDAMAIFELAVARVNNDSAVIKIDLDSWKDFVHDELPTARFWQERINEARDVR